VTNNHVLSKGLLPERKGRAGFPQGFLFLAKFITAKNLQLKRIL
jgi:hypothetical protein